MKQLHYKGFTAEIDISIWDDILHGKLIGIDDLVTFEAMTVAGLKKEFKQSVDNYIKITDKLNKETNVTHCPACGVPTHLHNTCCGWRYAKIILYPKTEEEKEWRRLQLAAGSTPIITNTMNTIPTQTENPNGLHQRYAIKKLVPIVYAKGMVCEKVYIAEVPVDPNAEYFVLRLDYGGKDHVHVAACRKAVLHYAELIKDHLPELSKDLISRYGPCETVCNKDEWISQLEAMLKARTQEVEELKAKQQ